MKKSLKYTLIGIIVIISLLVSWWGISFLKGKDLLDKDNEYFAIYDKVDGLITSSPVTINGFKVGQVRNITFHTDNSSRLVVYFTMRNDVQLPDSTIARITSIDLMGTKAVELVLPQHFSNNYHKTRDTLISAMELSLKDQVSIQMLPVKNKAEALMVEMQEAMEIIKYIFNKKTRDDLTKSFRSIKVTMSNLEHSSENLDTLVQNESIRLASIMQNVESITSNLKNNNQHISHILTNLDAITDSISKSEFTRTINNVNNALVETEKILEKINKGEGTMGLLVNDDRVYNNLEKASDDLDLLIKDVKENPKKYVRYSLFDFGKTINVMSEEEKQKLREKEEKKQRRRNKKEKKRKKKKNNSDISFKVQIKSTENKVPLDSDEFKGLDGIEEFETKDGYKYCYGSASSVEELLEIQGSVRAIFPDAFAVGVKDGKIIPYKDAIKEID